MLNAEQNLALECLRDVMRDYVVIADRYINDPGTTPSGKPRPRPNHRFGGEFMANEGGLLKDLGLIRNYWDVDTVGDVWVQTAWDHLTTKGLDPAQTDQAIENWVKTTRNQSSKVFEIPQNWTKELIDALDQTGRIDRLSQCQAQWTDKVIAIYKDLGWWSPEDGSRLDAASKASAALESDRNDQAIRLIQDMPAEVADVLRAELGRSGPINLIKEIGRYWRNERWHTDPASGQVDPPFPLRTAEQIVQSLRVSRHE